MKLFNPFMMNDWKIKNFMIVVHSIQLAMWGLIGCDTLGINLLFIRPIVACVYLLFIPGFIVLRLLKIHNLGLARSILYSVGLSITFLMFVGFTINQLFPSNAPLSLIPSLITITLIILILSAFCYNVDKEFTPSVYVKSSEKMSFVPIIALSLVPFFSVFATYFLDTYHTYVPIFILIFVICSIVILIGFDIFIAPKLYPLAAFVIAISILFPTSLPSNFVAGWDIQTEYYLSNLVIKNSFWDLSYSISNGNAMLSIVTLAPLLCQISDLDLVWVFKIVYPLIFSLVPLGLYTAFEKLTGDPKISFIAVFFFMSLFVFYTEMLQLARQQIAELYVALILLLIVDDYFSKKTRQFLFIIFTFSLSVSHYGLSYLFILTLIFVQILSWLHNQFSRSAVLTKEKLTFNLILLFIVFTLSWYIHISSSSTFTTVVYRANSIIECIHTDILNPSKVEGLHFIKYQSTLSHTLTKYIHLMCQFFITIGMLKMYLRPKDNEFRFNFNEEYKYLCAGFFLILLLGITVPNFSNALNTSRLYQISLLFLSLPCVLGGIVFFRGLINLFKVKPKGNFGKASLRVLSIYFIIFFLFNGGFIYQIEDGRYHDSLSYEYDYPRFNNQELIAAKWLYQSKNEQSIYADKFRYLLLRALDWTKSIPITENTLIKSKEQTYIFLGSLNTINNILPIYHEIGEQIKIEKVTTDILTREKNKIYCNGGSEIYFD